MAVVVSDATPLNYLILIGAAEVLPRLYGRVLVPPAVRDELNQPGAPENVRAWLAASPTWLEVIGPRHPPDPSLFHLDAGEREAITLALELSAELLLIDERDGVAAARERGLVVTGTLGVLDRAAALRLIDLPTMFDRLQRTTFRAPARLMAALLEEDAARRRAP